MFGLVVWFAVYTFNRLLLRKLEVWKWVVKRRIVDLYYPNSPDVGLVLA